MATDVRADAPNMRETTYRTHLEEYSEKWRDMIAFRREDSILEVRFHTDGGQFLWGPDVHKNLIPAFFDIASDPDNECLIVTGTGDTFISERDPESWGRAGYASSSSGTAPPRPYNETPPSRTYDHWYLTGTRGPVGILNMQVPIVTALNGPHHYHVELSLCADLVIASENAYFQDLHTGAGMVPGDGAHIIWPKLLGPNRGRAYLLTGQRLSAQAALELGVVHEVVPRENLLDRAWELARSVFMSQPRIARRMTHALLMQPWREAFAKEQFNGVAHEAYAGSAGQTPPGV
jgi:enoyl-CoA hydratase/carnithine racemase